MQEISVRTASSFVRVRAFVCGDWAAHRDSRSHQVEKLAGVMPDDDTFAGWNVTHIPSGMSLGNLLGVDGIDPEEVPTDGYTLASDHHHESEHGRAHDGMPRTHRRSSALRERTEGASRIRRRRSNGGRP